MTIRITYQCKTCRFVDKVDTIQEDTNFMHPFKIFQCNNCDQVGVKYSLTLRIQRLEKMEHR